jgi:hypothetical protein
MKRILISIVIVIVTGITSIFLFREPIAVFASEHLTADMFVDSDAGQFSPGIVVGEKFPSIRAWYQKMEKQDLQEFMGPSGLVVFVNRSVDW